VLKHSASALAAILCVVATATPAIAAPCDTATNLDAWFHCRILELQKTRVTRTAIEKQPEQPSLSSASTSLLDKTSASDMLGMGLNLFTSGGNTSPTAGSSPTITASTYALVTAARGDNPLDPAVYNSGKNWRRFSFTLGHEEASVKENLTQARIFGGKVLLLDRRDVSSGYAKKLLAGVDARLPASNTSYASFARRVNTLLYEKLGPRIDSTRYPLPGTAAERVTFSNTELAQNSPRFQQTLALLTDDESNQVDEIALSEGVVQAFYELDEEVGDVISRIRTAPQVAISYAAKIRDRSLPNDQVNEHRFEASFDYGVARHISITVNGSYEYRDSKTIGADRRGGRVAGEWLFELNHDQALAKKIDPYTFSLSAEGKFLTSTDDILRVQTKLVVPVTGGVSLPISLTYSNRTELINESDVRGQFGFTFDLAKLAQAFMGR
jgi:hypothetical protein